MTVLLTGLGYIGARLAADLLDRGERVIAVESFFSTPQAALRPLLRRPGLRLVEGSVNRAETLERAFAGEDVRAVVLLAAQASSHPEAADLDSTERTNLTGARHTLEAARRHGVPLVVHGSSFWVYGDHLPPLVGEDQPYGVAKDLPHLTKLYVEKLGEMMALQGGPRFVSARLGITYGLGPVVKTDPRFMTVPHRFCQLVARGERLTIHTGAVRPAGYVRLDDASRALAALIDAPWSEPYRPVNVAAEALTVRQVADAVLRAAARRGLPLADSPLEPPVAGQTIAIQTSLAALGAAPAARLEESVDELLDFFLAREQAARPAELVALAR